MSPNIFQKEETAEATARMKQRQKTERRVCRECGNEKGLSQFRGRVIKHMHFLEVSFRRVCIECCKPDNVARVAAARKKDPVYSKACAYWSRSRRLGFPSDLRLKDIRILLSCPCFYCECCESPMTLDRKNSEGGYTKDNVVPCCFRCNTLKSDMPWEAWKYVLPAIRNATKLGLFKDWRTTVRKRQHQVDAR